MATFSTPLSQPSSTASRVLMALRILIALLLLGLPCLRAAELDRLYVDLRLQPDASALTAFDLSILRPDAEVNFEPGHGMGHRFFAHLGALDPSLSGKASFDAAKRGFNGFVFVVNETHAVEDQVASLRAIRRHLPDKDILLAGAFWRLQSAWTQIDGVLAQGVFQNLNRETGRIHPVAIEDSLPLQRILVEARRNGLSTYVMDFADKSDAKTTSKIAEDLAAMGASAFITDDPLGGAIVGPWHEQSRTILVVHGWNPTHLNGQTAQPENTLVGQRLHAPLEWLGYRLQYLDLGDKALPRNIDGVSGIILDGTLLLTRKEQAQLAEWTAQVSETGLPILLTGQPWTDPEIFTAVASALHLDGTGQVVPGLNRIGVSSLNSEIAQPAAARNRSKLGFFDLQAPADAEIFFSLRGTGGLSTSHFDSAFLTPWGGVLLDATTSADAPVIDELAFVQRWLKDAALFPVPDTTTRDGRRLLLLHTESEGFSTAASVPGLPTCGQLTKSRVLDCYWLPFTVGFCEAELRGWLPGLDPRDAFRYEEIARQILALPQVEAASATFSRPAVWSAASPQTNNPDLNELASDRRDGFGRQIGGSLAYLHREILPANQRLEFVQWPSKGTPSREALAFAKKMGAKSLIHSASTETGARTFSIDSQEVVHLPSLTNASDEADFRESANELRRRPLSFRFDFNDSRTAESLTRLRKRLDLCASQALQPIRASDFVQLMEDAAHTRILEVGPRHWMILNDGRARTVRLPISAGVPHLRRCRGVSGYEVRGDQIYVHTLGTTATELVMTDAKLQQDHLYLQQASSSLRFHQLSAREVEFEFRDLRPGDALFAGLLPESACHITLNGKRFSVLANASGKLHLDLPQVGHAHIRISPPAYAVSR